MTVPQVFTDEITRLTEIHGVRVRSIKLNRRLKRAIARTIIEAHVTDSVRMDVAPWITEGTDDEIRDTARHEYAHALDWVRYGKHGHGPTWKMMCRVTECKPTASKELTRSSTSSTVIPSATQEEDRT